MSETNPCAERLDSLMRLAARRRLDAVVVFGEANIRSLTGVVCDNGCLLVDVAGGRRVVFCTDFRYVPMVHRVAPWLCVRELRRGKKFGDFLRADGIRPKRLGYEGSISAARYLELKKRFPKAALVAVNDDLLPLRAVKHVVIRTYVSVLFEQGVLVFVSGYGAAQGKPISIVIEPVDIDVTNVKHRGDVLHLLAHGLIWLRVRPCYKILVGVCHEHHLRLLTRERDGLLRLAHDVGIVDEAAQQQGCARSDDESNERQRHVPLENRVALDLSLRLLLFRLSLWHEGYSM